MQLRTIPLGNYQANCYSIIEGDQLALVDPGDEGEKMVAYVEKVEKKLRYILITHGHFDHVGAVSALKSAYPDTEIYVHQGDAKDTDPELFPLAQNLVDVNYILDGDKIPFGKGDIEVHATPGHSKGSVCLGYLDNLYTGDTLFFGSMGRTDLPGGSYGELMLSLAKLAKLPEHIRVFPGHGEDSTIGQERKQNPYMMEAMKLHGVG